MPSSLVEVRCNHDRAVETAIIDAVHDSLIESFRIPPGDRHIRLVVHDPDRFAVPPTLTSPELYTLVTIDCFAGRSIDAKRQLYAGIVGRLGALGIPGNHVTIIVRDIPTTDWGIRAGQAASDVELGFAVDV